MAQSTHQAIGLEQLVGDDPEEILHTCQTLRPLEPERLTLLQFARAGCHPESPAEQLRMMPTLASCTNGRTSVQIDAGANFLSFFDMTPSVTPLDRQPRAAQRVIDLCAYANAADARRE